MIQQIEEKAMNAWPAPDVLVSDGWVLRFAGGYTRRANSVLPLYAATRSLDAKIDEAERLYRARRLAPTFKMTRESRPDRLDVALTERGYVEEARTSVQVAGLAPGTDDAVCLETSWERSRPWRDAFHRMGDIAAERGALHDRILASISLSSAFASVEEGGRIVGCALGVVQDEWLGIFDLIVDSAARRCGHGEKLMRGLMAWGQRAGADRAYLQVMLGNSPAHALYDKLGFREAYQYWYRVSP
jgi:N-acetylglutamate synthase